MIAFVKRELALFLLFTVIVIFSQQILLAPHSQFGFSPDDVWLFSDFSSLGTNPFSKFPEVWKEGGAHDTMPLYYNGILFSFLGFNYPLYHTATLIFKIFSIISFYILIRVISKNKLLSFLSGLIFSLHYASMGGLEMVTRTQDYLVITGINIFLILFYIGKIKKINNIFWLILAALVLFISFIFNPIRAYPLLVFIFFVEFIIFFRKRSLSSFYHMIINEAILFAPFILFIIMQSFSKQAVFYRNLLFIIEKVSVGNIQLALTPFATLGSLFLTGEALRILTLSGWSFNNYFFAYLWHGPLLLFGGLTIILAVILSEKPIKFIFSVVLINYFLDILLFFIVDGVLNLPPGAKMHYDPSFLVPPTILGIYVAALTISVLFEWVRSDKRNPLIILYLLGMFFTGIFIWFTWLFQDYVSVPMGLHGYTTLPSLGISLAIASILTQAYKKTPKPFSAVVFLVLIPYLFISSDQIRIFFKRNLDGGMKAEDQVNIKNQFWNLIRNPKDCNKFFYISTTDIPNGGFYGFIMLDKFEKWYSLYGPYHSKTLCPVAYIINDENKLRENFTSFQNKQGFFYKNTDKMNKFFPVEDFYAFKLQDRKVVDITREILNKIR